MCFDHEPDNKMPRETKVTSTYSISKEQAGLALTGEMWRLKVQSKGTSFFSPPLESHPCGKTDGGRSGGACHRSDDSLFSVFSPKTSTLWLLRCAGKQWSKVRLLYPASLDSTYWNHLCTIVGSICLALDFTSFRCVIFSFSHKLARGRRRTRNHRVGGGGETSEGRCEVHGDA